MEILIVVVVALFLFGGQLGLGGTPSAEPAAGAFGSEAQINSAIASVGSMLAAHDPNSASGSFTRPYDVPVGPLSPDASGWHGVPPPAMPGQFIATPLRPATGPAVTTGWGRGHF